MIIFVGGGGGIVYLAYCSKANRTITQTETILKLLLIGTLKH